MAAQVVRRVVAAVCAVGIAGMIVGSVVDSQGAVLTFGLLTAAAVLCLLVATAVGGGTFRAGAVDDTRAAAVEALVRDLVGAGADEAAVRTLVREASRLRDPAP